MGWSDPQSRPGLRRIFLDNQRSIVDSRGGLVGAAFQFTLIGAAEPRLLAPQSSNL